MITYCTVLLYKQLSLQFQFLSLDGISVPTTIKTRTEYITGSGACVLVVFSLVNSI